MHNNYMEAVVDNESLVSQALSNNAQKICIEKITQVKLTEVQDIGIVYGGWGL